MCPPEYFDVSYEINPWMHVAVRPNHDLARRQWDALYQIITNDIGADVSLVNPEPGVPDMVFTANAGLARGQMYIPTIFRYKERQPEMPHFRRWFTEHAYVEKNLAQGPFEGEGDALNYGEILLVGFGPRTAKESHSELAALTGQTVISLGLVDTRYYHLDVCFAPLSDSKLIYHSPAFDAESQQEIIKLPGEKFAITEADADHFGANAIVIGEHVVVNSGATDLVEFLSSQGFRVHPTDLSEFTKAGGSAKCLTMILGS
jgi:N-dimethylarginine dimethylaminohydrolase